MTNRLNVEQKRLIEDFRKTHIECASLSDAEILTIMNEQLDSVRISEDERVSAFWNERDDKFNPNGIKNNKTKSITLKSGRKIVVENGVTKYYASNGTQLNPKYFEQQEGIIDIKASGRYSVTKGGATKYYAADGTELKESYFKKVENSDVTVKAQDGKTYNVNKTLENRINRVTKSLQKAERENGFIGKAWGGFKNLTGIGDSSDKVREQQKRELKLLNQFNSNTQRRAEVFKELTGQDYNEENLAKFITGDIKLKSELALNGYKEGQDMASDITGDIVSGIAAVGIYTLAVAAAPVTGGASIALGVAAAGTSGALIKTGVKFADAKSGGREYNSAGRDLATGAFSGVLAPVTGGMGGAVGKTVATKCGIEVLKQGTKEVITTTAGQGVKQGLKTAFVNATGYSYGGTIAKKALAYGAEMATDGALGGSIDTAFRTAYDGGDASEVLMASIEGGIGGLFLAPVIGGGMKLSGKAGHALGTNFKEADNLEQQLKAMIKEYKPTISQFKKRGATQNFSKFAKSNSINKMSLKAILSSKGLKGLKGFEKRVFVKAGEPRFTAKAANNIIESIDNPYLKENKEFANSLFKRISEMQVTSSYKGVAAFYRFTDSEVKEILSTVNNKNVNILEIMLNAKINDDFTFSSSEFAGILKEFSKLEPTISEKVVKMCAAHGSAAEYAENAARIVAIVNKYPKECAFLTSDFHPSQVGRFMWENADTAEELVKFVQTCSPEQREIVEMLCSPKLFGGSTSNKGILKLVQNDLGLNPKQIITLAKNCHGYLDEILEKNMKKLTDAKGKLFEIDSNSEYVKSEALTHQDMKLWLKKAGVSEDTTEKFLQNTDFAETIIQLFKFDDIMGGCMFKGAPKNLVIKQLQEMLEQGLDNEGLKFIGSIKSIMRYFNKENYDLYKLKSSETEFNYEAFFQELGDKVINIECKQNCELITKLTGRKIYESDLLAVGSDVLLIPTITEKEMTIAIKKLRELNLLKDDANVLTLLTRAKGLADLEITPNIKEFAEYLSSNKFIEEGTMIDLINSVKGATTEISQTKINFIKQLLDSNYIHQQEISDVIVHLSKDNITVLNRQIELLQKLNNDNGLHISLELYAELFKANKLEDVNLYAKMLDKLIISKPHTTDAIIRTLNHLDGKNLKQDLAELVIKLSEKKYEPHEILEIVHDIQNYTKDNGKEFIKLYSKGLDADLGSLKESYKDVVLLEVADIKHLNIKQRLDLYDKISMVDDNGKAVLKQLGFNYDNLLDKVINSLGSKRALVTVPNNKSQLFIKQIIANNNPKAEKILQEFDFAQFGKEGLPLRYSRNEFNSKVEALLKDLPQDEVDILLKHFGLEKGTAGFDGLPNNRVFDNKEVSKKAQQAAQRIQHEIENFTVNNEVMIADREVKEVFDGLIKGFPEFTSIVGKQQHGQHIYSVDIHTLKVLQSAMNDPLYKTLSDQDKTIMKYAILLHDLGKKGGVVDKGHAGLSADYTWSILDRYPFPPVMKDRIIDIVDNHHWFEAYNQNTATAENVAVRCRRPEDLKIYEIFSKADFENVNPTFHLGDKSGGATTKAEFDAYMQSKFKDIEEAVNKIYEKANYVFDTQFMHSGRQFPTKQVEVNGKIEDFKVLNFSELKEGADLSQYGFAPGVTRDNARFIVHMTEPKHSNMETVFRLTETPIFQSTWSSSLIQLSNNRTYWNKKFGLIFDAPQSNISEAFFRNSGSGGEKGLDAFQHFLFGARKYTDPDSGVTYDVRHFVKLNFIKEMAQKGYDLTETEYAALSQYLFKKKYLTQLRQDVQVGNTKIKAQDLVDALEKSRDTLFEGGDIHSEIIPINPKVKGLIAKVEKLEDCPPEFLKFAKEHDLPIILMKPTDADVSKKMKK